jgi:hypothetical protein
MPDCSLCKETLPQEGGAILFTDRRGVPFEVCGKCEGAIGTAIDSKDDAEVEGALNYISERADNVENRDTYDAFFSFLKKETPEESVQQVEEEAGAAEEAGPSALEEEAATGEAAIETERPGKRKFWPYVLVIVLVGLLALVYIFGGVHLG